MVGFTAEEDTRILIMYENGEAFKDIAESLERSRSGVQKRYKTILDKLEANLKYDIETDARYGDPTEPSGWISAKAWAERREAQVKATWTRRGPLPASLYTDLPDWPESDPESPAADKQPANRLNPESEVKLIESSARVTGQSNQPLLQLQDSSVEEQASSRPDLEEELRVDSAANQPTDSNELPIELRDSCSEDDATPNDHETVIKGIQQAHKAAMRALESKHKAEIKSLVDHSRSLEQTHETAMLANETVLRSLETANGELKTQHKAEKKEQKILIEFYRGQAGHPKQHVSQTGAERTSMEQAKLIDHYKAQAEEHKRRVQKLESENSEMVKKEQEWVGEKADMKQRIKELESECSRLDRDNNSLADALDDDRNITNMPAYKRRRGAN